MWGRGVALREHPAVDLLDDAGGVLLALGVEQMGEGKARRTGEAHLAAQGAHPLDQQRGSTGMGRADSRRNAGGTAAAYDHVISLFNSDLISCHNRLPFLSHGQGPTPQIGTLSV